MKFFKQCLALFIVIAFSFVSVACSFPLLGGDNPPGGGAGCAGGVIATGGMTGSGSAVAAESLSCFVASSSMVNRSMSSSAGVCMGAIFSVLSDFALLPIKDPAR